MPPFRNFLSSRKGPTTIDTVDENQRPIVVGRPSLTEQRTNSSGIRTPKDEVHEYQLSGETKIKTIAHLAQVANTDGPQKSMTVESIYRYAFQSQSWCTMPLLTHHDQPSPTEKKSFWSKSPHSTISSNHRSLISENEPFSISRESFESYRRSFVSIPIPKCQCTQRDLPEPRCPPGYLSPFPNAQLRQLPNPRLPPD